MIKAVFLDVDNTLLDFDKCSEVCMKKALKKFGLEYKEELSSAFERINEKLWREMENGALTREELFQIRWNQVFAAVGIETDGAAFEQCFVENMCYSAEVVDGALELLVCMAEKYTVCIASNAPYKQQIMRLEAAGMFPYLDHIFISEKIGAEKPKYEFFRRCFESLPGVLPEETIMIGDSLSADICGGIEFGMKTCWFNKKSIACPKGINVDYIVEDLSEIKYLLR